MSQKRAAYDDAGKITAFYDDSISPAPEGANTIELTNDQYQMLLDGQSIGKRMAVDESGSPVLLDPLPPSGDQLADIKRAERDAALSATDWIVARNQDEVMLNGQGTSITGAQLTTLLEYRKALRDLPEAASWPNVDLPAVPDFVTAINA